MSVIKTQNNLVCAYEPEPEDLFVQVVWHGPAEDGIHLRGFEGAMLPIEDYQAAVDWAVGIADVMAHTLHVVPLRAQDAMSTDRVKQAVAGLSDQDRGELRRFAVAQLAEVMRDCDDPEIRREAFDVLADMGVVRS